MTAERPTPEIIEQAAFWSAQLATGEATPEDRLACEAWCRENPLHRLTMDRMRGLDAQLDRTDDASRDAIGTLLKREPTRGRRLGRAAMGLVLLVGGGWFAAQSLTVRALFPDHETGRGAQRHVTLADGSTLDLDTDAAVDFDRSASSRTVTLFQGRIFARVTKDPARPFVVETSDGKVTALGTAFIVERNLGETFVTVIESRVRACAARTNARDCADLEPGDRARMSGGTVQRLERVDPTTAALWTEGWLAADNRPVAEILLELNRYRAQPARFDTADLDGVRVSGSFPLADADRALLAIADATGLRMERSPDGDVRVLRPN